MRKSQLTKIVLAASLAFCLGTASGCASTEGRSTIFSLRYWKRHVQKIGDDFHAFRVDVDRIIFDLEDQPIDEGY